MDVLSIPFNKFLGIEYATDPDFLMTLPAKEHYENHLRTVHASALFALAEASSGLLLLREFSEIENVVPVVRNVEIKYKKPGSGAISSKASLTNDRSEIIKKLQTKQRAIIPVEVSLYDANAVLIMQSIFEWFVLINVE
ncbi:MAG: PaaI family thioesterase [Thermoguttaceae bacterium]